MSLNINIFIFENEIEKLKNTTNSEEYDRIAKLIKNYITK